MGDYGIDFIGYVRVRTEVFGDALLEFVGDAYLFLPCWTEAHTAESVDDAIGCKDSFASYIVVVSFAVGGLLDVIPLNENFVHCLIKGLKG